jgi:hypothetical protein
MLEKHDFDYAMENTRIVVQPRQAIETFGVTRFHFSIASELLDEIDTVRVRSGTIEAERPRIIATTHFSRMLLDGFGERAREFADWLEENPDAARILRYGFRFKKTDLPERILREPLDDAIDRLREEIDKKNDPLHALIAGVDDTWEVCLLKFSLEMIKRSAAGNVEEWKRRGLA